MSAADLIVLACGGAIVLFGLVFVAIGTIRGRMTRDWVRTTGQVINRYGDPLAWNLFSTYPTFRWRDASGAEHQATSSVYASFGPRPGKLVVVNYDPQDPSQGVIDSFVQGGQVFTLVGSGIAVIGVLGALFAWWVGNSLP